MHRKKPKKCELCKTADASSNSARYCYPCKDAVMTNRDKYLRAYYKKKTKHGLSK